MRRRLDRFGAVGPGGSGHVIHDNIIEARVADAYMLCTSLAGGDKRLKASFGEHCIRIAEPRDFHIAVAKALDRATPLRSLGYAPVQYEGRELVDARRHSESPYFANVSGNAREREARFVWLPVSHRGLAPMTVDVPEVVHLLSRV